MAFLRYANAMVVHPRATQRGWDKIRTAASKMSGSPSMNLVAQASEILGSRFDPQKYLLTHSTIVSSVDTMDVPGVKLGSVKEGGKKVNRKWADYRITPETQKYTNNNFDAFDRQVLLMSYPTFIGAHNFCEHVQIADLSKGRIIDAAARDIGESIYIDILVATDRRHTQLVKDISSGKIATLSMGCSCEVTRCTNCGHVAVDETDLCDHIRYAKGNTFFDDQGRMGKNAELCGHKSIDPTGGITFIEASWVASPAFTGAVMRNIIEPRDLSPRMAKSVQEILSNPPDEWVAEGYQKAAHEGYQVVSKVSSRRAQFDLDDGEEAEAEVSIEESPPTPFEKATEEIYQAVIDKVMEKVKSELSDKEPPSPEDSTASPNDSVIKQARRVAFAGYAAAVKTLVKTASCDADLVNSLVVLDESFGMKVPRYLYKTALLVGSSRSYETIGQFLMAARHVAKRPIGSSDAKTLIRLGKILTLAEEVTSNHPTGELS